MLSHSFDGDGFVRFREEYRYVEQWIGEEGEFNEETTTRRNLWSTVLRAMIAELDEAGNQKTGFVYAGSRIARLDITPSSSSVKFELSNPQTQTSYETDHAGKGGRSSEYDPLGAEVPKLDPYFNQQRLYTDLKAPGKLFTGGSDPFRYDSNCQLDGMPISCSLRQQLINNGAIMLEIGKGPTAERIPIDSYGMGIYRVDYKYWVDHGPPERRPKLKFPNGRTTDVIEIDINEKNGGHWQTVSMYLSFEFSIQGQKKAQPPQVPVRLGGIEKLDALMKKTIVGDCDKALRELLKQIGKGSGVEPSHKDVLSLYTSLRDQTGGGGVFVDVRSEDMQSQIPKDSALVQQEPAGGGGLSWFVVQKTGPPKRTSAVFLLSRYTDSPPEDLDRYVWEYFGRAVHETVHHGPSENGRFYSHEEMDSAARVLGFANFDRYVKQKCYPPKFRWPM